MNLVEQVEAESLKKQYIFLSGLIKQHHREQGSSYQQPQSHKSVPYSHPSFYSKVKTVRPSFHDSSVYKSKCHPNISSFRNAHSDVTSRNLTVRNYLHQPASVLPKQSTSFSAKQAIPWKYSKASSSTQKLSSSSFKTVRTSNSANVTKFPNSTVDTKFDNFKKPVVLDSSENSHSQSSVKNDPFPGKGTKVSYLPCSDCVIKISEYENGELHITQEKAGPSVETNLLGARSSGTASGTGVSSQFLSDYEKSTGSRVPAEKCVDNLPSGDPSSVCSKLVIEPESQEVSLNSFSLRERLEGTEKGAGINAEKAEDTKLASVFSGKKFLPSSPKLTKSQPPCARNAKYSKINAFAIRSTQNSAARQLLKNKQSVKKLNVTKYNLKSKCKMNREVKKAVPHPLKYTYIAKPLPSTFSKSLVNSVVKKTVLSPVKNADKQIFYASCSQSNTHEQSHIKKSIPLQRKISIAESNLASSPYARISRKAKTVHLSNVYKVVNKSHPVASRIAKSSPLRKGLCEKSSPNDLPRCGGRSSDKKWFAGATDGSKNVAQCSQNVTSPQNSRLTKGESEKMLCSPRMIPLRTSSYKLKNVLNGSKIITRHSLRRVPLKKNLTKRSSFSPSHKLLFDSHTPIKRAKVRLSKTTYKVVNRHVNHVSQVVQMIKTKYRTVNKRSASNSHLKWLQEQKKTYIRRKLQKPHDHAKGVWTYHHSSSAEHFRKHPTLHSKSSRKQSLGQNKVLKKIRGVNYKVSKTKINKSFTPKAVKKNSVLLCNLKNSIIVNVRGNKFQLAPGGKSLKRIGTKQQGNKIPLSRIKIGGFTYVWQNESPGHLVRFSSQAQNLASRMLHRSIHTVRAAAAKKTMQKSNMFCMFFNRFGRCNKEGKCRYIHDPSKIAVCARFLRGTCKIDGCPFSHEVSPGKMAVCCFFLQGNCTNDNCPYQHTSIKPGTRLCKAFVKGYCKNGSQCQDAHILACPQLICEGFCEKGSSCTWPHPPVKKNTKKASDLREVQEIKEKNVAVDDTCDLRYFTYEPGLVSGQCIKQVESHEDSTQVDDIVPKIRSKKIKFNKQPEFIPLHVSDEEL